MPLSAITNMWRQGKISFEVCQRDASRVREVGVQRLTSFLEWYGAQGVQREHTALTARILKQEQAGSRPFRHHEKIDLWRRQYDAPAGTVARFKTLVMRGKSRSGKTQKACSIYGFANSLVLNAQGMDHILPCMTSLDRSVHQALVLDEACVEQVLANKQLFQAGARAVQLGQSKCNQHAYSDFVYMLPIILTSNKFPLTEKEGLSPEDADWLEANVIEVPEPFGHKWWVADMEDGLDEA